MIDLEKLLEPIGDDAPAGVNLREVAGDSTLTAIEDLRREDDQPFDGEPKPANWPGVIRACELALGTRTKDLQLAAWLTEALARTDGFAGLHAGLSFVRSLLERYWDTVHPGLDEGDVVLELRARPISWLVSTKKGGFIPSVKRVPLVGDLSRPEYSFGWWHFEQAELVDGTRATNEARYEEMVKAGMLTGERWTKAVAVTPAETLRGFLADVRACEDEVARLQVLADGRFGPDEAPVLIELRDLLETIRKFLAGRVGEPARDATDSSKPSGASGPTTAPTFGPAGGAGPVGSREQALTRLREVADFFRRTEPHSPVSRLVERAVRWGGMSFEDVLRDVIKSPEALGQVWETLGISQPTATDGPHGQE